MHDDPGDDDEGQRQPVAVGRVGHADEQVGHGVAVERAPLLAARHAPGVAHDDDRRGLRERQRHHREGDAADTERDPAHDERQHRGQAERHEHRERQGQRPRGERDRQQVAAGCDEQGVPEAEQPGAAEEDVVAQGDAADDEAGREQLHRAGPVDPSGQDARAARRGRRAGRREVRGRRRPAAREAAGARRGAPPPMPSATPPP